MSDTLRDLVMNKQIIVCCGAGGVGKTTTSTGLALAAARRGRRVLALTVDPSRRLAETLGVGRNLKEPVSPPKERLAMAGIEPPGLLETWMLDPALVSDRMVHRLAATPEEAERLKEQRIYRQLSRMVAGMQEYMAMEALYEFVEHGRYDLIILDTPPARNALNFLEGPGRLGSFLQGPILSLFQAPEEAGFFRRAAAGIVGRIGSAVFGEQSYRDLQDFFSKFRGILGIVNRNAADMVRRLSHADEVGFVMVSSPAPEALQDAFYFQRRALEMGLPFSGFVLNRSQALELDRVLPDETMLPAGSGEVGRSALAKLRRLALLEHAQLERDQALLGDLAKQAGKSAFAIALPTLPGGAADMASLLEISEWLMKAEKA